MKKQSLYIFMVLMFCNVSFADVNTYKGRSEIPEKANPNYETLKHYLFRYLYRNGVNKYYNYTIKASNDPYQFQFNLKEDKYLKKQMQKTALLSYLLYEDNKIVIDKITSKDRFGEMFTNESKYFSQSIGKSLVSYVTGHAICEGYIESVDSRLNDWFAIQNTLYHNQKLIDLLNMRAGDQKYVVKRVGFVKGPSSDRPSASAGRNIQPQALTVQSIMTKELKNSTKEVAKYNYNNLVPNLIMTYVLYKSNGNFQNLLDNVFKEKVGIENDVYFQKNEYAKKTDESVWYQFYATRYDYLRIAKSMLDDWQNDTCVGKYLKTIYERRENKYDRDSNPNSSFGFPKGYAGQFHTDYPGMKNRPVFGMDGYGGQSILIDFERSRIVSVHAIHGNYNWKKIVYQPIKKRN